MLDVVTLCGENSSSRVFGFETLELSSELVSWINVRIGYLVRCTV